MNGWTMDKRVFAIIICSNVICALIGLACGLTRAERVSEELSRTCETYELRLMERERVHILFPGELESEDQILLAKILLEHAIDQRESIGDPGPDLEAQLQAVWEKGENE